MEEKIMDYIYKLIEKEPIEDTSIYLLKNNKLFIINEKDNKAYSIYIKEEK